MTDPLYQLLKPHLKPSSPALAGGDSNTNTNTNLKYLARLVSLRLSDLTTTEPQSIAQSSQTNLVSIQALSSRSHRTTTTSSDHLSTLRQSLPLLTLSVEAIRDAIPDLDSSAVSFASSYSKSREDNTLLNARKNSALLARQADKAQDILELPGLLSAAIASASTSASGSATSGANYSQALDLFAHIKRLQILYPDSRLVKSVLADAEVAMKDMTTNLIANLRSQNIRLAAAIRTIGWLRRVAPELTTHTQAPSIKQQSPLSSAPPPTTSQDEGHFGALFLCARLATFLTMTEALSPLRDLADQETMSRKKNSNSSSQSTNTSSRPPTTRQASSSSTPTSASTYPPTQGQQTERYLKRYLEIFREQSFSTISMYRNIFPTAEDEGEPQLPTSSTIQPHSTSPLTGLLTLPSALNSFPLHLVSLLTETLRRYLPNITDSAARESLLMQVLYAAGSLGRLGADFSLMIALLDDDGDEDQDEEEEEKEEVEIEEKVPPEPESELEPEQEPEWITMIKKHRVQAARLEALAAGQDRAVRRQGSSDIAVR